MAITYNYNVVLGLSFTGITLVQTVKDLDDVTVAGLTKTFTEIGGGDYVCKIVGLAESFDGYVVITNSAGGGHLAVENIYTTDIEIDLESMQDDIDLMQDDIDDLKIQSTAHR